MQPEKTSNQGRSCIEPQQRVKKCALINTSSLFDGIFVDAQGVNCTSLQIVCAKKYFTQNFFMAIADVVIET